MPVKKPSPIQKLMLDYVEAVNAGNKRLANKLVKELDALKAGVPSEPADEAGKAEKTTRVRSTRKQPDARVTNPKITAAEASYMAPARRESFQPTDEAPVKGMRAQWREVGKKPFVNKFVDNGTDDLPPKHKKIDKKLAKTKRESEPRDPIEKVEAVCYVCNRPVMVYPSELERISDDERVMRVNRVRCNQCMSTR